MNCETRKRGKLCGREECKPCFSRSFASCEMSKYMVEGQGNPLLIARSGMKKISFVCPTCNHKFEMNPNSVSDKRVCPFCSSIRLCEVDDCVSCQKKSFQSHEKANFWDFERNDCRPRDVFRNSGKKFWFKCEDCGHAFKTTISNISAGTFCPFCASSKLCGSKNCEKCFEKSFASSKKSGLWDFEKNTKVPEEVFLGSHKKFWFKCEKCSHSFEKQPQTIKAGYFCPFCANRKLCTSSECELCTKKSFHSVGRAKFWCDAKNKKRPREAFSGTREKFWFACENGHEFRSSLYHVTSGSWCPKCTYKTEKKLFGFLEENFESPIHQFRKPWCKNPETGRCFPFDFCVSKTIIELDGIQHYEQVSNWKSPEAQQKNDRYKEERALKNGYSVIRILQEDVWKDRIDWKTLLLEHIRDYGTPIVKKLWMEGP